MTRAKGQRTQPRWTYLVPVFVALLLAAGWLLRTYVLPSRDPTSVVAVVEQPPKTDLYIRLDNQEPENAVGGFSRFDDVKPGQHQLEFRADGYRSHLEGPFEVSGGREKVISVTHLEPSPERSQHGEQPMVAGGVTPSERVKIWSAVPVGSILSMRVEQGSGASLTARLAFASGRTSTWEETDFVNKQKILKLDTEDDLALRMFTEFTSSVKQSVEFVATVTRPDGSVYGLPYSRVLSGVEPEGDIFMLLVLMTHENP